MAKGEKVHVTPDPSSDEYDSCDENDEEYALKIIKKYGKDAASKILKLMYKIEKREACIESQGELLLVEREKN